MPANPLWENSEILNDMKEYYQMVLALFRECATQHQVNSEESMRVLTELEKALTTARITGQPLDELLSLKRDVQLIRAMA